MDAILHQKQELNWNLNGILNLILNGTGRIESKFSDTTLVLINFWSSASKMSNEEIVRVE